jgi:hypothetical protein
MLPLEYLSKVPLSPPMRAVVELPGTHAIPLRPSEFESPVFMIVNLPPLYLTSALLYPDINAVL